MSILRDSLYPSDHPFSLYVHNLRSATSVSWFSRSASINTLRDYLWGVMRLSPENAQHAEQGFARTSAGTVLFIAATSDAGAIITCFPLNEIGVDRINNARNDERETMISELKRGAYMGNSADAQNAVVEQGEDAEESGVFDFVNGATIARLDA
ncbi:hypothetical protein AB0P21_12765 [Kribbella sp. NPDC056861]|uniref:hypothetical protein n=1 Tax=Kribbella sp. NPDC056861 TaxID=3154857 RepID=UPI0034290A74